jgi:RimJ/RimL family protein N-acetyltransferase
VSYTFLPAYWGLGFAAEAVEVVLAWASAELPDDDVLVCTQTANEPSLRLAQRLGFIEISLFEEFGSQQWLGRRPV